MKKILLAMVMLAFLAGCSGPADQDQKSSQKATPQEQTAAHQHFMKDFGKMRNTKPTSWNELARKSPQELKEQAAKAQKRIDADIKELKEGQK